MRLGLLISFCLGQHRRILKVRPAAKYLADGSHCFFDFGVFSFNPSSTPPQAKFDWKKLKFSELWDWML